MRVLKWVVDRVRGRAASDESPIGWTPRYQDIDWDGLAVNEERFAELVRVDRSAWKAEVMGHEELFLALHDRLPARDGL